MLQKQPLNLIYPLSFFIILITTFLLTFIPFSKPHINQKVISDNISWKICTNSAHNYSVQVPSHWIIREPDTLYETCNYVSPIDHSELLITFDKTEYQSLAQYLKNKYLFQQTAWEGTPSVITLSSTSSTLSGYPSVENIENLLAAGFKAKTTYVKIDNYIVQITARPLTIDSGQSTEASTLYPHILSTFKIAPQTTTSYSNMKLYSNDTLNYEIRYPTSFFLKEINNDTHKIQISSSPDYDHDEFSTVISIEESKQNNALSKPDQIQTNLLNKIGYDYLVERFGPQVTGEYFGNPPWSNYSISIPRKNTAQSLHVSVRIHKLDDMFLTSGGTAGKMRSYVSAILNSLRYTPNTSTWVKYSSNKLGFSMKYPPTFSATTDSNHKDSLVLTNQDINLSFINNLMGSPCANAPCDHQKDIIINLGGKPILTQQIWPYYNNLYTFKISIQNNLDIFANYAKESDIMLINQVLATFKPI